MIDQKTLEKFANNIPKRELQTLQDISVFQDSDGTYNLFNKYMINKTDAGFVVTIEGSHTSQSFSVLKNAVTWCTLDKRDRISEANRVLYLDIKLASLDTSIAIHNNLLKKSKTSDDKLIYIAKLTEEKVKKRSILHEIDGFIMESKRWQAQRFDRKPSH